MNPAVALAQTAGTCAGSMTVLLRPLALITCLQSCCYCLLLWAPLQQLLRQLAMPCLHLLLVAVTATPAWADVAAAETAARAACRQPSSCCRPPAVAAAANCPPSPASPALPISRCTHDPKHTAPSARELAADV
jgi:hypothetical protein